jgi:hypothetical protein
MVKPIKHEFEDGTIVSEVVIDIELQRTKGRVTREEALDLARVANNIRTERDQYRSQAKLGVGDGTGELFVQGDYDSIKACQQKLLDLEKYRQLFFAAIEYIDKSPCDPDITTEQAEAWLRLQTLLAKRNEKA